MARIKSKIQKKINAKIKEYNPESKAFEEVEFRDQHKDKNLNAIRLEALENGESFLSEETSGLEKLFERELAYQEYTKSDGIDRNYLNAVSKVFGVEAPASLLKKLMHHDYLPAEDYLISVELNQCTSSKPILLQKIDLWIHYCALIDRIIQSTKIQFPNWNKRNKAESEYINAFKLVNQSKLIEDSKSLENIISFFDNYGFSQGKLAKAKYLLSLHLPKVTTLDIAKNIVTYSSLNKKSL